MLAFLCSSCEHETYLSIATTRQIYADERTEGLMELGPFKCLMKMGFFIVFHQCHLWVGYKQHHRFVRPLRILQWH